ncbi:MAG: SDR family NAD(P)-dependent oxidoreductase [Gammaproteobacteria bacterium]
MPTPSAPRVSLVNQLLDRSVLPGMLTFARPAYLLRQRFASPLTERMEGRRVVITGATSGLGLASAHALANLGASLVLVGRDPAKLAQTAAAIGGCAGIPTPATECADLAEMSQVRTLAARLLDDPAPIHVLINNAGALFAERALTCEGHERSFAVNLLSPFLLTNLLIPRLVQSAPARIVNVSSGGMYTQGIDLTDLQNARGDFSGSVAYAKAKRGQVILTQRWAQELANRNVVVHAMHPGWADTPGVRTSLPTFFKLTRPFLRSAQEGADTIVWLATAKRAADSTGGFWLDRQPHLTHVLPGTRCAPRDEQRLWDSLEALSADH